MVLVKVMSLDILFEIEAEVPYVVCKSMGFNIYTHYPSMENKFVSKISISVNIPFDFFRYSHILGGQLDLDLY